MPTPFFHTVRSIAFLLFCIAVILSGGCTSRKITDPPAQTIATSHALSRVNINTADRDLLETLPHVGPTLADKIILHRTNYGPFGRVEHLLLIEGLSETRFNAMRHLITAE